MIHGYGLCGSGYYSMIKHLKRYFRVTSIDLLGMGCSGRPNFELKTAQQCIDYFILSIEAWVQATKYNEEPFYILGHSLGGYLSVLYSI